jgi:hypothetical protein
MMGAGSSELGQLTTVNAALLDGENVRWSNDTSSEKQ